jgi:hypothetical protein
MKVLLSTTSSDSFYSEMEKLFFRTAEAGLEDHEFGM